MDELLGALCVWREAMGEGEAGMQAVAFVLANRLSAGFMGARSLLDVVTAQNQFSSLTVLGDHMTVKWPNSHCSPAELQAWQLANRCMQHAANRDIPDPTSGALYYFNPATATSGWFVDHVVNSPDHPKTASIGHHEFFK